MGVGVETGGTTMRRILFVGFFVLLSPGFAQAQRMPYRVVFDLTSRDSLEQKAVLRWIREIGTSSPDAQMEVVMYAKGFELVMPERSAYIAEVKEAMKSFHVTFIVCAIALKNNNVAKSQLIPEVQTVPDGIYEIVHCYVVQRSVPEYQLRSMRLCAVNDLVLYALQVFEEDGVVVSAMFRPELWSAYDLSAYRFQLEMQPVNFCPGLCFEGEMMQRSRLSPIDRITHKRSSRRAYRKRQQRVCILDDTKVMLFYRCGYLAADVKTGEATASCHRTAPRRPCL